MTWSDAGPLALALAGGLVIGAVYFAGLWWTVQRLPHARRPWLLVLGSSFVRTVLAVALLWLLSGGQWQRLVAGLLGFVLARLVVTRVLGRRPAPAVEEPTGEGGDGAWN